MRHYVPFTVYIRVCVHTLYNCIHHRNATRHTITPRYIHVRSEWKDSRKSLAKVLTVSVATQTDWLTLVSHRVWIKLRLKLTYTHTHTYVQLNVAHVRKQPHNAVLVSRLHMEFLLYIETNKRCIYIAYNYGAIGELNIPLTFNKKQLLSLSSINYHKFHRVRFPYVRFVSTCSFGF